MNLAVGKCELTDLSHVGYYLNHLLKSCNVKSNILFTNMSLLIVVTLET